MQTRLCDQDFDYGVKEQGWERFDDFPRPKQWDVRTVKTSPKTPVLDPDFEYNKTRKSLV